MVLTEAEQRIFDDQERLDAIFDWLSMGGDLDTIIWRLDQEPAPVRGVGLIRAMVVKSKIIRDPYLNTRYFKALDEAAALDKSKWDSKMRAMCFTDIRDLMDENGKPLPLSKWPPDAAALVAGVETAEQGIAKLRIIDRNKSLELFARSKGFLIDKKEISGKLMLEDLLSDSGGNEGGTN
jgi:hypothetical protein